MENFHDVENVADKANELKRAEVLQNIRNIIRKAVLDNDKKVNQVVADCKGYLNALDDIDRETKTKLTWSCFQIFDEEKKKIYQKTREINFSCKPWLLCEKIDQQLSMSIVGTSVACSNNGAGMFFGDDKNRIWFAQTNNQPPRKIWEGEENQLVTALKPITEDKFFSAIWLKKENRGTVCVHEKISNMWNNYPRVLYRDCLKQTKRIEFDKEKAIFLVDIEGGMSLLKKNPNFLNEKWMNCADGFPAVNNASIFDSLMSLSETVVWVEKIEFAWQERKKMLGKRKIKIWLVVVLRVVK